MFLVGVLFTLHILKLIFWKFSDLQRRFNFGKSNGINNSSTGSFLVFAVRNRCFRVANPAFHSGFYLIWNWEKDTMIRGIETEGFCVSGKLLPVWKKEEMSTFFRSKLWNFWISTSVAAERKSRVSHYPVTQKTDKQIVENRGVKVERKVARIGQQKRSERKINL